MSETRAQQPIVGRHYDDTPLRIGNAIYIANPDEKRWAKHRYLFTFGQIGCTFVLVYGNDVSDALEDAAAFCADAGWRGIVVPFGEERSDEYVDLGCDCADPFECEAHTYTESGWLDSYEWNVTEDPSNEDLRRIHKG